MHLSGSLFFACAADHATWRRFRKYAIIRKDNLGDVTPWSGRAFKTPFESSAQCLLIRFLINSISVTSGTGPCYLPFPFNPVDDGPLTDLSTYGHWKSNESRDLCGFLLRFVLI